MREETTTELRDKIADLEIDLWLAREHPAYKRSMSYSLWTFVYGFAAGALTASYLMGIAFGIFHFVR